MCTSLTVAGAWRPTRGGQLEQQISWFELNIVRIIGYPILIALSIALIVIYRLYIIADDRALHDELTHLPNRRYFMQSYKQQFEIAKRYKKTLQLCVDQYRSRPIQTHQ